MNAVLLGIAKSGEETRVALGLPNMPTLYLTVDYAAALNDQLSVILESLGAYEEDPACGGCNGCDPSKTVH